MGQIRIVRTTEALRVAHGGIEVGRFFWCTDSKVLWMGSALGDIPVKTNTWDSDALPLTPSDQDDQFDDGVLAGKWTEWDLGVPQLTITEVDTFAVLTHATEAAGRWRGMYQDLPVGEFTIVTKASGIGSDLGDSATALCLFEDGADINADILIWMLFQRTAGNNWRDLYAQRWSDYQTFSANYDGGDIYPNTTTYLRIRRDAGNNLYFDYSSDGISWQRIHTLAQPFVPLHMGIATQNNNTGITVYGYFDMFRYIASDVIGPIGRMG